jgi:hypothetical protein
MRSGGGLLNVDGLHSKDVGAEDTHDALALQITSCCYIKIGAAIMSVDYNSQWFKSNSRIKNLIVRRQKNMSAKTTGHQDTNHYMS